MSFSRASLYRSKKQLLEQFDIFTQSLNSQDVPGLEDAKRKSTEFLQQVLFNNAPTPQVGYDDFHGEITIAFFLSGWEIEAYFDVEGDCGMWIANPQRKEIFAWHSSEHQQDAIPLSIISDIRARLGILAPKIRFRFPYSTKEDIASADK